MIESGSRVSGGFGGLGSNFFFGATRGGAAGGSVAGWLEMTGVTYTSGGTTATDASLDVSGDEIDRVGDGGGFVVAEDAIAMAIATAAVAPPPTTTIHHRRGGVTSIVVEEGDAIRLPGVVSAVPVGGSAMIAAVVVVRLMT
jgi:hypothetical protein